MDSRLYGIEQGKAQSGTRFFYRKVGRMEEGALRARRIVWLVLLLATIDTPVPSWSDNLNYPVRSIRLIVPFAAGGPTDVMARLIAQQLTPRLGQTVVVENVPGAGGVTGSRAVARAEPDGYTTLFGTTSTLAIAPAIQADVEYDPVKSFAAVARVSDSDMMLVVNPSVPARSVEELVRYAKANPGKLNYASAGVGTPPHVTAELFKAATDTDLVHIPYKGGGPAIQDVVAGQVQLTFESPVVLLPLIRDGKLRALAVTGRGRNPALPDVPTMVESGISGFVATLFTGVVAPAGTSPDVIRLLNGAINSSLETPEMRANIAKLGSQVSIGTPQDFAEFIEGEFRKWSEVARSRRIKID